MADENTQVIPEGTKEFTFTFRTEKIRDEQGNEIGEGPKTPPVKVILPFPSDEDMINFLGSQGKEAEYIRDIVYEAIKAQGRGQINEFVKENPDKPVTADILDLSKLTFSAIANTPRESRAKPEIPEEVFNTFYEQYKTDMLAAGKEVNRVQKHIALFKTQFRTCKFDKPALQILKDNLNLWAAKTEAMADNVDVFEFLTTKVDRFLKAEEKNLVAAL